VEKMGRADLISKMKGHADAANIRLNPDTRFVEVIIAGLLKNEEKYGPGKLYCPCRPVTADEEMNRKIICPCTFHMDEIKRDGKCHCGLFVKQE
jgi:ferredoxin-thioredoxin reductase catalytic subunit